MKTNEQNICVNCKYYWGAFGYFDEMSRCTKRNIPIQDDCTCSGFIRNDSFYTDMNDLYDEQGNTDDDSSEFNFD